MNFPEVFICDSLDLIKDPLITTPSKSDNNNTIEKESTRRSPPRNDKVSSNDNSEKVSAFY